MPSIKQLAAMLRRAGELARRALRDVERSVGGSGPRWGDLLPDRVVARQAAPRQPFRPPFRQPFENRVRHYHVQTRISSPILELGQKTMLRHAVIARPQVRASMRPHELLRRPYSFFKLPTIPLQLKNFGVVDFDMSPHVLLPSNYLTQQTAQGLIDSIKGQISHLQVLCRDIMRMSELGSLPVTLENDRIRVHFDNSNPQEVTQLVREAGIARGVVHEVAKMTDDVPDANVHWSDAHTSPALSDSATGSESTLDSWVV